MKKLQKLMLCCIMLLSIFIMSACSEVRVMMMTNTDGTIDEMVYVSLDCEELLRLGYSIDQVKLDIRTYAVEEADAFKDRLNLKIAEDLMITTGEADRRVLISYRDGISPIISEWSNNNFMIGIRFRDEYVYKYFYNIAEANKLEPTITKGFWYDKYEYAMNTMYIKHYALYESINTRFSLKYADIPLSDRTELMYTYVADKHRQHSDADFITRQGDKYYHTWVVDRDEIDQEIHLYYNIANQENWILVALVVTFVAGAIITIIVVIIHFIKKKKISHNIS